MFSFTAGKASTVDRWNEWIAYGVGVSLTLSMLSKKHLKAPRPPLHASNHGETAGAPSN